jgi:putative ABC transport system substrate-binding protein
MSVHGTKRTSSDVRLVSFSGAQRKWDFGAAKAAFDPKRTFCRLDLYRKIAYAWPKASGNSMRRREFVGLIGGAAAWPGWAYAQQARTYTVGVLTSNSPNPEPLLKALREGLHDAGYVEGGNLRLEIRSAAGTPDLLLEKAAELVRLKVDLIVTFFTPAALAAKKATGDVPIVMAGAGDPVASGLVASLTRPGGNVTGQSSAGAEVAGKSVELIRELIPTAHRLGVLVEESDPFAKSYVAEIRQAALSAGMEIEVIMIRSELSQEATFKDLADKPLDGLVIQGSIVRKEILDLAMKHRLPTVTSTRLGPSLGALMSYGSDYFELARQSAVYVDKILKGAKPADLPVAFPTKFLLIINATTAKALGLNISPMMLGRADEVIE